MLAFPYWCSETFSIDGKISSWSPVTQTDHKLLEEAIKTQEKLIYIETKRTCADLTKRSLRGCYDFNFSSSATSPPFTDCDRRIIRATWFYLDSSSTVPLSEEVSKQYGGGTMQHVSLTIYSNVLFISCLYMMSLSLVRLVIK